VTSSEPETPDPVTESAAIAAVPAAPVIPGPPVPPPAPIVPEPPAEPATTSSGLPNPYGLPEIAVERPEVGVGAAFAGGLVVALILKRFAR
jgi:hypothetical protein